MDTIPILNQIKSAVAETEEFVNSQEKQNAIITSITSIILIVGCLLIGILVSTIAPKQGEICDIVQISFVNLQTLNITQQSNLTITESCIRKFFTKTEIQSGVNALAIITSITLAFPLMFYALLKHKITYKIDQFILVNYKPKLKQTQFYLISIAAYVIALIIYSITIWRMVREDFVGVLISSIFTGICCVGGQIMYHLEVLHVVQSYNSSGGGDSQKIQIDSLQNKQENLEKNNNNINIQKYSQNANQNNKMNKDKNYMIDN